MNLKQSKETRTQINICKKVSIIQEAFEKNMCEYLPNEKLYGLIQPSEAKKPKQVKKQKINKKNEGIEGKSSEKFNKSDSYQMNYKNFADASCKFKKDLNNQKANEILYQNAEALNGIFNQFCITARDNKLNFNELDQHIGKYFMVFKNSESSYLSTCYTESYNGKRILFIELKSNKFGLLALRNKANSENTALIIDNDNIQFWGNQLNSIKEFCKEYLEDELEFILEWNIKEQRIDIMITSQKVKIYGTIFITFLSCDQD